MSVQPTSTTRARETWRSGAPDAAAQPAPGPRHGGTAARAAAAAAAGLAQLFALPPYGWWFLTPIGVALVLLALRGTRPRRAAWLGAVSGAALMVPLVHWQAVFGVDVWLATAAVEILYYIPMAIGITLVSRTRGWIVWTSALWVAQELIRARWPFGGFGWGKLAYAQPDTIFTGYASWGSSALVSFMVALTGALLAAALLRLWRLRRPDLRLAGVLAVLALIFAGGALAPRVLTPTVDHMATVGVVQGDVPQVGEISILGERQEILDNHLAGVADIAEGVRSGDLPQPDFVVLPENATDVDPYIHPEADELIRQAAADVDAPLLIGASHNVDDSNRSVRSVVWDQRDGPGDYYEKRHPVPFGEYVPFRDILTSFIDRLDYVPTDAVRGTEPGDLDIGGTTVGAAICFDVAFDPPVRDAMAAGGQMLVVPTNNANYNFTGQSDQQLAITQLRAVEHGRPAVVAATSGVSAVVNPDGSVMERSPEAEPWTTVAEVPAMEGLTPATRLGALPEWVIALLGLGAVVTVVVLRRRTTAGTTPDRPAQAEEGDAGNDTVRASAESATEENTAEGNRPETT